MPKIVRLTLFKIPDQDLVKEAIQMYNTLAQDAKKVRQSMTRPPKFSFLFQNYVHTRC